MLFPRHHFRFAFLVIVVGLAATCALANPAPAWTVRTWDDTPVQLELPDAAALQELLTAVPLARFDRETVTPIWQGGKLDHLVFQPRVTAAEKQNLIAAGYQPVDLPDTFRANRTATERQWARRQAQKSNQVFTFPLNAYPTHPEIGTILADIAAAHPAIARTFQWGASVQNRKLWGIVISSDVNNTAAEPEVRLSSTMHGDEVTGMVMLLDYAEYLTTHYGQPGYAAVTNLVDNYEIHIMPLHNPDGYVAGSRANGNFVDLNRDYPLPSGIHPTQQIETTSFMNYANAHRFVISENGHGGALVANYPWDYQYVLTPDNDAIIQLSLEYSRTNLPMYNGVFPQGITNGAAWYVVNGSIQDWSYEQTGCIDVTIEHSNTKWPAATALVGFWNDNRQSLLNYTAAARYGINGVVTAASSGLPLDATVTVGGNPQVVTTDPGHGDYYKLLPTGTYDLTYAAPGYVTQTITGISTTWGTPTVQNVALALAAQGTVTGKVRGIGGPNLAAQIEVYTSPLNALVTTVSSDPVTGAFNLSGLFYGNYRLVATAPSHAPGEQMISLMSPSLTLPTLYLTPAVDLAVFNSAFEGPTTTGWIPGAPWGTIAPGAAGTGYSMTDSPLGPYNNSQSTSCTMTNGMDLSALSSGSLTYQAKWDIETNWDGCQLQVSVAGGLWTPVVTAHTQPGSGTGSQISGQPYYEGSQANWITETVDLAPWLGQSGVRFRFLLGTDSSVTRDGFTFDEFVVIGSGLVTSGGNDTPAAVTRLNGVFPNPFNPATLVSFELDRAEIVQLTVYDISGRLVRTLVDESFAAGAHRVRWDGLNSAGVRVSSGMYFVQMQAGQIRQIAKAVLVK